jgi:hypothetical protein
VWLTNPAVAKSCFEKYSAIVSASPDSLERGCWTPCEAGSDAVKTDAIEGLVQGAVENAFVNWAESPASCARKGACSGFEKTPEKPTVSSTTTTTVFGPRAGFTNNGTVSNPRIRITAAKTNNPLRLIAPVSDLFLALVAFYARSLIPDENTRDSLIEGH